MKVTLQHTLQDLCFLPTAGSGQIFNLICLATANIAIPAPSAGGDLRLYYENFAPRRKIAVRKAYTLWKLIHLRSKETTTPQTLVVGERISTSSSRPDSSNSSHHDLDIVLAVRQHLFLFVSYGNWESET